MALITTTHMEPLLFWRFNVLQRNIANFCVSLASPQSRRSTHTPGKSQDYLKEMDTLTHFQHLARILECVLCEQSWFEQFTASWLHLNHYDFPKYIRQLSVNGY